MRRLRLGRLVLNTSRGYDGIFNGMIIIMFRWERMQRLATAVNCLSPEIESPVDELPRVIINLGVLNDHRPLSNTRLTP